METLQIASKLSRLLLMPPANLIVLIGVAWLARRRWPRTGRALGAAGAAGLLIMSTDAGALLLVAPLENLCVPLDLRQASGAQAIVVLGGGSIDSAPEYGGVAMPKPETLIRLAYGAHVQHATGLPLMVSGGNADPARAIRSEAAAMAQVLRDDFRTQVAWVEDQSPDTAANALYSARLLKAAGLKRVLLVTQALHMPRARTEFARQGIEVVAAPTLFYSRMPWSGYMLVPSASGMYRSYYASHEWIGMLWYRLRAAAPVATPAAPNSST